MDTFIFDWVKLICLSIVIKFEGIKLKTPNVFNLKA